MAKTALERISQYLRSTSGNVVLSEADTVLMNRARAAWELSLQFFTKGEIAERLVNTFDIKSSTAYTDIEFCYKLFSNPLENQKKANREIASNYALQMMKKYQESDAKMAAKFLDLFIKANQLDKDDPIIPDYDKIQIADIVTAIDPRLELFILKQLKSEGPTDLTELYDNARKDMISEEIDFEELPIDTDE